MVLIPVLVATSYLSLLIVSRLESGRFKIDTRYDDDFASFKRTGGDTSQIKSKDQFIQIFLRCSNNSFDGVYGNTYEGSLLDMGILAPVGTFIMKNNLFGPGKWFGKTFSASKDYGYNEFLVDNSKIPLKLRKFDTKVVRSVIDGEKALQLKYSPYNAGHLIAWGMQDNLRALDKNADVLVGCGGLLVSGGVRNFAPFVLYKKKK